MKTWDQLKEAQPLATKMLMNSVKKERVSHAYLFEGDRGTGKKDSSFQLTKTIFCKNRHGINPCHQCSECDRIESGNHPDVHVITPEGQSIKKEQIQHLQKEFTYTGLESNKKVYIVEHADRMTNFAANQILKFLEEPSQQTTAILLSENMRRMLPTIISRCQIISFKPLPPNQLYEKIYIEYGSKTLAKTASALTNNVEEAVKLCNDEWFAQARSLVIKLNEVLFNRGQQSLLFIHEQWIPHFTDRDLQQLGLDLMLLWYKDLLYAQLGQTDKIIFIDQVDQFQTYTLKVSERRLTNQLVAIMGAKQRLSANVNPQLLMEQLVLKLQGG